MLFTQIHEHPVKVLSLWIVFYVGDIITEKSITRYAYVFVMQASINVISIRYDFDEPIVILSF